MGQFVGSCPPNSTPKGPNPVKKPSFLWKGFKKILLGSCQSNPGNNLNPEFAKPN